MFIGNNSVKEDTESAFDEMRENDSICDLERNVSDESLDSTIVKMDKIKTMFSRTDLTKSPTDDEALESVMNSLIQPEVDNNEGLSSMGSDVMSE